MTVRIAMVIACYIWLKGDSQFVNTLWIHKYSILLYVFLQTSGLLVDQLKHKKRKLKQLGGDQQNNN